MSAFFTSFTRLLPRIAAIMLITHTGCALLPGAQKAPYRYMVDTAIVPSQPELPGLSGGPPRQVAVLVGPTGRKSEFGVNEVMYQPKNADGFFGEGATLTRTLSGPPVPCNPETVIHTITLKVRASESHEATHLITMSVGFVC